MRIDIPEQAIQEVQTGQSVSVTTSAWPDRRFNGRIARIAPNVSATSRTLTVEAEIDNRDGALKPGQFATVRILQERPAPVVFIPARAVISDAGVSRVFVIKDGHAEQRVVQTGPTESDLIQVKSGISNGEQVATSNLEKLGDGMAVKQWTLIFVLCSLLAIFFSGSANCDHKVQTTKNQEQKLCKN